MTSFLSDKNINYLQYELRQRYPENKWVQIQSSVRDAALVWFKQHSADLELVYQQYGIRGLNNKFIGDMIASAEYFDGTNEPVEQRNQLFDTDITDPNIVADQPMPYVTGVENPIFTFAAFSKGFDAKGKPEAKYIYRQKPNYGNYLSSSNPNGMHKQDFMEHTLAGPGNRSGNATKYSDYEGSDVSYKALMRPTEKSAYNITDSLSEVSGVLPDDARDTRSRYGRDGFNRLTTRYEDPDDLVQDFYNDEREVQVNDPSVFSRADFTKSADIPSNRNLYSSRINVPRQGNNLRELPNPYKQLNLQRFGSTFKRMNKDVVEGYNKGFDTGVGLVSKLKSKLTSIKSGFAGQTREADAAMLWNNAANAAQVSNGSPTMNEILNSAKSSNRNSSRGNTSYGQNYGSNMRKGIYNTEQPNNFPPAYAGYQLGTVVSQYDPESGSFVNFPNNTTSKTMKTLNQMTFGDVPVVTEMSQSEIAELGSRLYRKKDKPKRQRAPRQDGKCIPRQEYNEMFDDYPTNQPRAKFHLDQIYNTPESRINTIMDPVMGKSAMWRSQERSVLEIPCASMTGPQPNKASNRFSRAHFYPDGTADSWSVPGCNAFNSEPKRHAYPTRDFVPANYTTNYYQY